MQHSIHEKARGRWRSILASVGINAKHLTARHGPCPICGGKDRFRWDDREGSGSYFCNQCGSGNGIDLVMKSMKMDFKEAAQEVSKYVGSSKVIMPKTQSWNGNRIGDDIWNGGFPLDGTDPASTYLKNRGIDLDKWPLSIRYNPRVMYYHEDKTKTWHPSMVARMVGADEQNATTHITYLNDSGGKADLPKQKKFAPGKSPDGGAVRLYRDAETMGIAEGIETALSAMIMDRIPVWAALNTTLMAKWQPPKFVKSVIVYADNDKNFAGQMYANALANRLSIRNELYVEVRTPYEAGSDWNDELPVHQPSARKAG